MLYEICEIRYVLAPHFHAYYQDEVPFSALNTVDMAKWCRLRSRHTSRLACPRSSLDRQNPRVESNLGV